LDCGLILIKIVGFFEKYLTEEAGLHVDLAKGRGLFRK
jgi:hypothetical protein